MLPMNETFTPNDEFEKQTIDLLMIFDLIPDDFFYNEGISPSLSTLNQVKQYARLRLDEE
jgi:hypothetical protein